MVKVAVLTLGCKLNYAESSTYIRAFRAAGCEIVEPGPDADVFVVNTCTVTAVSDRKSRNLVRRVVRFNPSAFVVVVGCSAELRRDVFESIPGVSLVVGATEKSFLVSWTLDLVCRMVCSGQRRTPAQAIACPHTDASGRQNSTNDIYCQPTDASGRYGSAGNQTADASGRYGSAGNQPADASGRYGSAGNQPADASGRYGSAGNQTADASGRLSDCPEGIFPAYSTGERTRSFLKVQDGCNNFCRYCTVPYARGRSRNVPIGVCVRNAREIAAAGVKEIVLTGVNTGDFGRTTGESFLDLLKALDEVEGIERYRISSIEPNLLTHDIVDWIASGTKFVPHFHIPLQAGTDEILKSMGRRYTCAEYAALLEYIREKMEKAGDSKVFFGIDLMCGLPGETDQLFERSYAFVESLRPAFIHVFPYSRRPGTPAADMPGQVPEEVKHERVRRLEELCARLHQEFIDSNRGVRERVLFESTYHDGMMEGYSGNYIRVSRPYDPALVGRLVEVVI